MKCDNATKFHRKSGVAQWRDLCVDALAWKCFFDRVGLRPTEGDENAFCSSTAVHGSVAPSFVIPTEAEGSAVQRTFPENVFSTERTRISCHAAPDKAARAPFRGERRMKCDNATKFHRKSGEAPPLPFCHPERSVQGCAPFHHAGLMDNQPYCRCCNWPSPL